MPAAQPANFLQLLDPSFARISGHHVPLDQKRRVRPRLAQIVCVPLVVTVSVYQGASASLTPLYV